MLTIDVAVTQPLTCILLHALDVSDNVPQAHENTSGIPRWLKIDAANDPEFGFTLLLCDYRMPSILDAGPIIALNILRRSAVSCGSPSWSRGRPREISGRASVERSPERRLFPAQGHRFSRARAFDFERVPGRR